MPPPSSLPWTGPHTPPRGSEPPGGCRLTTGAEPGIALLDEPGSALLPVGPKDGSVKPFSPGLRGRRTDEEAATARLGQPGIVELGGEHRNVRRRQTGGAFRPGRLFLCRLIDNVDPYERAGAAIAGISPCGGKRALPQSPHPGRRLQPNPENRRRPGPATGFSRSLRKTADRDVPDAKRRTLRRPGTGERRARFPVRRKPVRRNEPGPVAMGRGRSRTGGRARFSASISCRNGSPAACCRPVSAKPAFRNGRKRPDWPLEARRRSFQGPLDRTARRENRRLEDKGRNRPDRPRVSGPAPAGVSPLTNRSTARSALPKRDAHQIRLTGRRPRCAARPGPAPSRRSRRPARLRRPRTARRR